MLPLAPDYYRRNFLFIVDFIKRYRGELIDPELSDFLDRVESLSVSSQCLYVRLITRKGYWFRTDKLSYAEVPDLSAAICELKRAKLIALPDVSFKTLSSLLTLTELREHFSSDIDEPFSKNKAELVELIGIRHSNPKPWLTWWSRALFDVIQQLGDELVQRLCLLFFGNLHQNLSEFVVSSLAHVQYPSWPISPSDYPFSNSSQVLAYQQAELVMESWREEELTLEQCCSSLKEQPPSHPKLFRQWQKHRFELGRARERAGQLDEALALYANCYVDEARERRLRVYFSLERYGDALAVALAMSASPLNAQEQRVGQLFLNRLQRVLPVKLNQTNAFQVSETVINLTIQQSVEQEVITYLASQGKRSWHCENALIPGVVALMLWDVIAQPVSGVFVQPFQRGPLDLFHPEFRLRRQSSIENCLREWGEMESTEYTKDLLERYDRFYNLNMALIQWRALPRTLLLEIIPRVAPSVWVSLARLLLQDIRRNRAGLPDLVVIDGEQVQFIEVKGPGDKLRANQRWWLEQLVKLGLDARLLRVEADSSR